MSFRWVERQRKFHDDFTVHGTSARVGMPWVNHWWPDAVSGGSSAWGARKLAWLMGFNPVVLCGCPLEIGPYTGYRPAQLMSEQKTMDAFHRSIEAEPEWRDGVSSMSGWSARYLGEPC